MRLKLILLSKLFIFAAALIPKGHSSSYPIFFTTPAKQIEWLNLEKAWKIATGKEVVIAVIDTGFRIDHPDLKDNLWINKSEIPNNGIDDDLNGYVDDIHGWNFAFGSNDITSFAKHGTLVTSMASSSKIGVARNSRWMALSVTSRLNHPGIDIQAVIDSIYYAVDNGAQIINLSLGSQIHFADLLSALRYAESRNVFVTASAGNHGQDISRSHWYPCSYSYLKNLICVGGLNSDRTPSKFSNFSKKAVSLAVIMGDSSSECLLGAWHLFSDKRYICTIGTSETAPLTAGVAALLLEVKPDLKAHEIKEILMNSGKNVNTLSGFFVSPRVLNAHRALQYLDKHYR